MIRAVGHAVGAIGERAMRRWDGRFSVWRRLAAVVVACSLSVAVARDTERGTSGEFDYYLLALSWSPTYCLTHPHQTECELRGYGFVLHGLWPQYFAGGWPERCQTARPLTAAARAFARSIYPSPGLGFHEWQTHGVCSGLDALDYFKAADSARTALRIPRWLEAPERDLRVRPATVVQALRDLNPALRADGVVVTCARGELAELRICLGHDLLPSDCGRAVRSNCPAGEIGVPASR